MRGKGALVQTVWSKRFKLQHKGCRSQWQRGLRHRCTAALLLRSWVRIPPGHGCLSVVSVACWRVEVSATS
jgi:hypothetical protein